MNEMKHLFDAKIVTSGSEQFYTFWIISGRHVARKHVCQFIYSTANILYFFCTFFSFSLQKSNWLLAFGVFEQRKHVSFYLIKGKKCFKIQHTCSMHQAHNVINWKRLLKLYTGRKSSPRTNGPIRCKQLCVRKWSKTYCQPE